MARICVHCGAELGEAAACPVCGAVAQDSEGKEKSASLVDQALNHFNSTADTSADFAQDDVRRNRWISIPAYLPPLFLLPLLLRKESAFARFHANQGILLLVFQIVALLLFLIPYIGKFACAVLLVISAVMGIYGMVNAARGKAKELPFVGKYRVLK
ncbi:MAG: hypothetical protein IJK64_05400 [Clostridia bacterium]|nr:hypothetical protein [Clostridia bacterium]